MASSSSPTAVVAVHAAAQRVAGGDICGARGPYLVTGQLQIQGRSIDLRHGFAAVEAEFGVEASERLWKADCNSRTPAALRARARSSTASIRLLPIVWFWIEGSTVIGPTPAIG